MAHEPAGRPPKAEAQGSGSRPASILKRNSERLQGFGTMAVEEFAERFKVSKLLGKGSFAVVVQADFWPKGSEGSGSVGEKVALKVVSKAAKKFSAKALSREVRVMSKANHPGCCNLLEAFEIQDKLILVQGFCGGGDMYDRMSALGALDCSTANFVHRQILNAVGHLHDNGICHRDLKLENLLLKSGNPSSPDYWVVRVSDFGLSCDNVEGYEETMMSICGTPEYAAPELHNESYPSYSKKVDVWACGIILYAMLSAHLPFTMKNVGKEEFKQYVMTGQYSFKQKVWGSVDQSAIDAIVCMLDLNPRTRPTIKECLEMPWVLEAEYKLLEHLSAVHGHKHRPLVSGHFVPVSGRPGQIEYKPRTEIRPLPEATDSFELGQKNGTHWSNPSDIDSSSDVSVRDSASERSAGSTLSQTSQAEVSSAGSCQNTCQGSPKASSVNDVGNDVGALAIRKDSHYDLEGSWKHLLLRAPGTSSNRTNVSLIN